ncbi:MAG: hypothetical protein ACOCX9_04140 [Spirochaetota bacterium]
MKKFGNTGIRWLKVIHLLFVSMWVGGGISLVLVFWFTQPTTGDELYGVNLSMKIIDDFTIIPGALGSVLIGIVYGIWTKWGFFRHRWITVKWVLTLVQVLFGTFFLGPWLNENVAIAGKLRDKAFTDPQFLCNQQMNGIFGILQVTLLLVVIWISVFKPWKQRKASIKEHTI